MEKQRKYNKFISKFNVNKSSNINKLRVLEYIVPDRQGLNENMCDKMFQPRGTSEIGKQESTTNLTAITSASSVEIIKLQQGSATIKKSNRHNSISIISIIYKYQEISRNINLKNQYQARSKTSAEIKKKTQYISTKTLDYIPEIKIYNNK